MGTPRLGIVWRRRRRVFASRYDFDQAASFLERNAVDRAPLVSGKDGEVVDVFSAEDVERIRGFPKLGLSSLGADGDFMVGATMGTREEDKERREHLARVGDNVVVLDSSPLSLSLSLTSLLSGRSVLIRSAHRSLLVEDVLSLSRHSRIDVSQLSLSHRSLSPKSLSQTLRLRLRRGLRLCRRRLPEIGASEALSRRRPTPHPTSNKTYSVSDGSNPFFDGRAFPKFNLLKSGVHNGHVQKGLLDPFCFDPNGKRKCQVTNAGLFFGDDRLLTGSILAHELMHGWLRLKDGELMNVVKLDMFVDKLPDIPKIYGFEMKMGFMYPSLLRLVFYFHNFLLSPISSSLLDSLASIVWKSFGLNVKSSAIDEDGDTVLEWENLPPLLHISHCKATPDLIYGCVLPLFLSLLS
ncbi:hypothetical protein Syun_009839 [Stephania yunnanensis]|uniref:Protein DA1-like domain-containing protein n=1 Tax=Stephania yunnanensis TaxID=152371 RepID=A0AAP0KHX0_9MAGN